MIDLIWFLICFLSGSLPLSLWLGKIALHVDIRQYGDGNPGAANVWLVGGKWWGLLAILLDGFKGLIPVAIANFMVGVQGWALVAVALAPILGHAYSPFLGFKGGKALAVTFGIWTGLTGDEAPIILGLAFAFWLWLLSIEGWAILFGMLTFLAYLLLIDPNPVYLAVWLGSLLIFLIKHRTDFSHPPTLRKLRRTNLAKTPEA